MHGRTIAHQQRVLFQLLACSVCAGSLCLDVPGTQLHCATQLECAALPGGTALSGTSYGFCSARAQAAQSPASQASGQASHEWSCRGGCIAGSVVAGVVCLAAAAALAAVVVRARRQRNSGPAAGSSYGRYQAETRAQVPGAALQQQQQHHQLDRFASLPSDQTKLHRGTTSDSDGSDLKVIELAAAP